MFTRRNFIKSSGVILIGYTGLNLLRIPVLSKEFDYKEENICDGESYVMDHEPVNEINYKQIAAADYTVDMLNVGREGSRFRYDPMLVEIELGQRVLWKAVTSGHNVEFMVAPNNIKFKSKMHKSAGYRFEVPGIYTYKCTPHVAVGMVGVVVAGGDLSNIEEAKNHKGYYGQSKQLIRDILDKY